MKLYNNRDEGLKKAVITIEIDDEEMNNLKCNSRDKKAISDGLGSDKISGNLKALSVIALKLEAAARKAAAMNLLDARLNKEKIVL